MKKIQDWPIFQLQNIISTFVILIIGSLILCGSYYRILDNSELSTLDLRFRLRPSIPVTDKIAIIEIGDDTIQKLGRFPFDRRYHALLIKILSEYGARAELFDVFFSESDKADRTMAQAIKDAGNVYLPYVFRLDRSLKDRMTQAQGYDAQSLKYFQEFAAGEGHINVVPDSDGKYRRVPLLIGYQDKLYPYLSLKLISDVLQVKADEIQPIPGKYLKWGKERIPLDEHSNLIVNYAGAWGDYYQHYSFVDVLKSYASIQANEKPILDLNQFKGKICLVGLTATGTSDLHPNPFASLYPALSIHADLINSFMTHNFISRLSRKANMIVLLVLSILTALGVILTKPLKGFLIFMSSLTVFLLGSVIVFIVGGVWIDVFYPLIGLTSFYLLCALTKSVQQWKKKLFLDNELQIARQIQESFLPKSLPTIPGLDVAAIMRTARCVGGDLYDFYDFNRTRLGVMIGDVSGKGIPASLFMTTVCGLFKFLAVPENKPQEALNSLNIKLTQTSSNNLFVTMFYAIFNMDNKVLSFSNGGHPPAMYLPKNKPVQYLDVNDGFPLGILEGGYSGGQVSFLPGDIFVFFTDGITEARNRKTMMYGNDRFASIVQKNQEASAQDLLKAIEKDVRQFEPEYKQSDDLTCIVVKVK